MSGQEVFVPSDASSNGPTMYNTVFGDAPLVLMPNNGSRPTHHFIQMAHFIRCIQQIHSPVSYHFQGGFTEPGSDVLCRLSNLSDQKAFYRDLNRAGFDFSSMPFKLQRWDKASKKWCLLSIDFQIMAACFLAFLEKNPDAYFIDDFHALTKLEFVTNRVYGPQGLDYIRVIPMLRIMKPGQAIVNEERLLLAIDERKVSFPMLKITLPAILEEPSADFQCFCFEQAEPGGLVYKAMCGHRFHRDCIKTWLSRNTEKSCPMCRRIISENVMNP